MILNHFSGACPARVRSWVLALARYVGRLRATPREAMERVESRPPTRPVLHGRRSRNRRGGACWIDYCPVHGESHDDWGRRKCEICPKSVFIVGNRRRRRTKRRTITSASTHHWPRDSNKTLSGIPGAVRYERTKINSSKGERWFCSEEEARAGAGRGADGMRSQFYS